MSIRAWLEGYTRSSTEGGEVSEEEERLRSAIQLIWSISVRSKVHLGLERHSGLRANCIPCICALALGKSMDGKASKEEFDAQLESVKHSDAVPE